MLPTAFSPFNLQQKLFQFLLRRYLGPYLLQIPTPSQLNVQLSSGMLSLSDLELNTTMLNEKLALFDLKLSRGILGQVQVNVPWRELLYGSAQITFELNDLYLEVVPRDEPQVTSPTSTDFFDDEGTLLLLIFEIIVG